MIDREASFWFYLPLYPSSMVVRVRAHNSNVFHSPPNQITYLHKNKNLWSKARKFQLQLTTEHNLQSSPLPFPNPVVTSTILLSNSKYVCHSSHPSLATIQEVFSILPSHTGLHCPLNTSFTTWLHIIGANNINLHLAWLHITLVIVVSLCQVLDYFFILYLVLNPGVVNCHWIFLVLKKKIVQIYLFLLLLSQRHNLVPFSLPQQTCWGREIWCYSHYLSKFDEVTKPGTCQGTTSKGIYFLLFSSHSWSMLPSLS